MKRVKRDSLKRAFAQGFRAGIKGHSSDDCPYTNTNKRGQWLGGWRDGHSDYVIGYRTEHGN